MTQKNNLKRRYFFTGFTMVELLIVISIIAILVGIVFAGNIQSSFQKAHDNKRKQDLNKMLRVLEDYYNDNQAYPPNKQVYPLDGTIENAPWGGPFGSYAAQLPQDPQFPVRSYFYQVDVNRRFFVIYAKLENKDDGEIERTGCKTGCGPKNSYNYAVYSSNVVMIAGLPNGESPPSGPTATPSPTFNPNPPVDPNAICNDNQCCRAHWCGAGSSAQGGSFCGNNRVCRNTGQSGWQCFYKPDCP